MILLEVCRTPERPVGLLAGAGSPPRNSSSPKRIPGVVVEVVPDETELLLTHGSRCGSSRKRQRSSPRRRRGHPCVEASFEIVAARRRWLCARARPAHRRSLLTARSSSGGGQCSWPPVAWAAARRTSQWESRRARTTRSRAARRGTVASPGQRRQSGLADLRVRVTQGAAQGGRVVLGRQADQRLHRCDGRQSVTAAGHRPSRARHGRRVSEHSQGPGGFGPDVCRRVGEGGAQGLRRRSFRSTQVPGRRCCAPTACSSASAKRNSRHYIGACAVGDGAQGVGGCGPGIRVSRHAGREPPERCLRRCPRWLMAPSQGTVSEPAEAP